jgi:hypothetical protein
MATSLPPSWGNVEGAPLRLLRLRRDTVPSSVTLIAVCLLFAGTRTELGIHPRGLEGLAATLAFVSAASVAAFGASGGKSNLVCALLAACDGRRSVTVETVNPYQPHFGPNGASATRA